MAQMIKFVPHSLIMKRVNCTKTITEKSATGNLFPCASVLMERKNSSTPVPHGCASTVSGFIGRKGAPIRFARVEKFHPSPKDSAVPTPNFAHDLLCHK